MAEKKQRRVLFVTPAGEAVWPYVNSPDDQPINGNSQTPAFKCRLRLDDDDDSPVVANGKKTDESLKELLDRQVDEAWDTLTTDMTPKQVKKFEKEYPYEIEEDDNDEPTGKILFNFKQNATIKVKGQERKVTIGIYDAKRNKITDMVGSGSTLKIRFTVRPYAMASTNKIGIRLDFNAVQVLNLVGFGGGNSDGFEDEDGYEGSHDDDASVDAPADTGGDDGDDDDEF